MKRLVVGTLFWLAVVGIMAVIALRWPIVFWLLGLSVVLYLIFGRKAEIEFLLGVGSKKSQRRLYATVSWQRGTKAISEPVVGDAPEFEDMKVEDRA